MRIDFILYRMTKEYEWEANLLVCSGMLKCIKYIREHKDQDMLKIIEHMVDLKEQSDDQYQKDGINRCIELMSA